MSATTLQSEGRCQSVSQPYTCRGCQDYWLGADVGRKGPEDALPQHADDRRLAHTSTARNEKAQWQS